jgi:hypothetical protein
MAKNEIHGLTVRAGALRVTTLEEKQERWENQGDRVVPLSGEEGGATWPAMAELLRAEGLKGPCAVGLPSDRVLMRVEEFPTHEPDELAGMVELQVDKFSPFPVEQMQVSYEQLTRTGASTRVLIVAVQRDLVEEVGTALRAVGLTPHRIDLRVLGWWRLLNDRDLIRHGGREAVLILDQDASLLIMHREGVPELFRALEASAEAEDGDFGELIAEELEYALTALEAQWGGDAAPSFSVWHAGPVAAGLTERLTELAEGTPPAMHDLESLPPVSEGLALRAVDDTPGLANLAPPEWAATEQAALTRRRLLVATGLLLLVWVGVVAAFRIALSGHRSELASRRAYLASLELPGAKVRETRDKAQFLERYTNREYSGLEALRAVSLAMPEGVDLSNFDYAKGANVSLRGSGISTAPILQFNQALQDLTIFSDVKLDRVDQDRRSGKSVFRITAVLAEEPL